MEKLNVVVGSACGLHARPASMLVGTAAKFSSDIFIKKDGKSANCKSILGVLSLGALKGDELEIIVEGADEAAAADNLRDLFENRLVAE